MANTYKYETFRAPSSGFDSQFTGYLNDCAGDNWSVKHCNYCHSPSGDNIYASCMFERSS